MKTQWDPKQYDKFKQQRSAPFYDLMQMVKTGTMDFAIDLGCGTGELTRQLFDQLKPARLLGIDSSREMLVQSANWAVPGLSYELRDITDFQPDAAPDLLFSNATLQWLPEHERLIPRLLDWVRPGGQVAIQVPFNFDHPSHQIAAAVASRLFPAVFADGQFSVIRTLTVERYAELLFANGFAQQNCRIQVYGHPLPSGADVIEWTKGTLLTGYQRRLSPEQFSLFFDTYRRELLDALGTGPYYYAFKRILLWGRKNPRG
ncbi:MAG TPA: methyltransferase domain-containing protein [Candidatus Acidoferrum sp.]|nr:methyltransferase domain-containing protein [Candidatus Acidoferrum sp.]